MCEKHIARLMIVAGFMTMPATLNAQEFPIAVGRDSTFSAGAVYGNTTGLVAILGDTLSQFNITAQLVYPPDSLIGNRISVGRSGMFPGAVVVFDGTNYLLAWKENTGDINGQFITETGNMMGTYFTIAANGSTDGPGTGGLAFSDTTYLAVFVKADTHLYGQRVSRSGNLIGGQIPISSNHAREISLAYDGTNYLVAWVEVIPDRDKDIYGQFVSNAGLLVGTNFLIAGGPQYSDNPTALACDGTRYLLAYHETPDTNTKWTLMGRFITTSGAIEDAMVICDSTKSPAFPGVAFDGSNYLTTWSQFSDLSVMGRFWTPSGVPVDTPFVIFANLANKIPFGGCGFGGGMYLAVASRMNYSFTDGDVYGRFIQPLTGVEGSSNPMPAKVVLYQNSPNPFTPSTVIRYQLPADAFVKLKVYDVLGREVATLVSGRQAAGAHRVRFNSGNLTDGVYFYRLQFGSFVGTRKLVLLR